MVKSLTLNPYMSLFNLKLWTHIWSTNINFRPPLHWTFWSVLILTFTLWVNCGRGVGWLTIYFSVMQGQKRDYLSRASQRARGATNKNWWGGECNTGVKEQQCHTLLAVDIVNGLQQQQRVCLIVLNKHDEQFHRHLHNQTKLAHTQQHHSQLEMHHKT